MEPGILDNLHPEALPMSMGPPKAVPLPVEPTPRKLIKLMTTNEISIARKELDSTAQDAIRHLAAINKAVQLESYSPSINGANKGEKQRIGEINKKSDQKSKPKENAVQSDQKSKPKENAVQSSKEPTTMTTPQDILTKFNTRKYKYVEPEWNIFTAFLYVFLFILNAIIFIGIIVSICIIFLLFDHMSKLNALSVVQMPS